jgi:hypothetical protein
VQVTFFSKNNNKQQLQQLLLLPLTTVLQTPFRREWSLVSVAAVAVSVDVGGVVVGGGMGGAQMTSC